MGFFSLSETVSVFSLDFCSNFGLKDRKVYIPILTYVILMNWVSEESPKDKVKIAAALVLKGR